MSEREDGGIESSNEILRRSRLAFAKWESLSVAERVARIHPLSAEILRRQNEIADVVCEENGKPRVEALVHEVAICLANLDYLESVAV